MQLISNLQVPLGLPESVVGLNDEQIARLTERIVEWILSDDDLLWEVAKEQASAFTLEEYRQLLEEEGHGEQV